MAGAAFVLLVATSLATARAARADDGMPAFAAAAANAVAAPPSGTGVAPAISPPAPSPQAPSQQADTDQSSAADARANQPQQSNVVIVIRINSPGDDSISQTNIVSVGATSANGSSTSQEQSPQAAGPTGAAASLPVAAQSAASVPLSTAPQTSAAPPSSATAPVSAPVQASAPAPVSAPAPAAASSQPAREAAPGRGRIVLAAYARSNAAPEARTPVAAAIPHSAGSVSQAAPPARAAAQPSSRVGAVGKSQAQKTSEGGLAHWAERVPAKVVVVGPRYLSRLSGGGRTAAGAALAADTGSHSSLVAFTLAALLTGLLGWGVLTYGPESARLGRLNRRG